MRYKLIPSKAAPAPSKAAWYNWPQKTFLWIIGDALKLYIHHSIHQTRSTWSRYTRQTRCLYLHLGSNNNSRWAGTVTTDPHCPPGWPSDDRIITTLHCYIAPWAHKKRHLSPLISTISLHIYNLCHKPRSRALPPQSAEIVDSGPDLKYQDTGLRLNICPILSVSFTIFNSPPSSV